MNFPWEMPQSPELSSDTLDTGQLWLRERVFGVKSARIARRADTWQIEIETRPEEHDGELWAPILYHQGLRLEAPILEGLQGRHTSWRLQDAPGYPHPERGSLYVFGHHDVRDCTLSFGDHEARRILLTWEGFCDVFWDEEFGENVPFRCRCFAVASDF